MKRIVVTEPGGPERLTLIDDAVPEPGQGEVLVAVEYSGVNFIDTYFRTGLYKSERPIAIGQEAAGIVEKVGAGVTTVRPGDRVAYAMVRGSYAEYQVVPAASLVAVPDGVGLDTAAAAMLQGMTAHYLTHSTFPLEAGQSCLVHAAAGGTGGLLVQMAKARGARVFGTVSTAGKAEMARALGADTVIRYTEQDFETEVRRLTDGRGVDVVYDSVGRATFEKSLKVLRPRGMLVLFGQSSGAIGSFDPLALSSGGSLYMTRPTLGNYVATREELEWRARDLFAGIASGSLIVRIAATYAFTDAAQAHRDLEGRKSTGKFLLQIA